VRQRKLATRVVGIGRTQSTLDLALQRGAVDEVSTRLAAGVRRAQLVILCTPVEQIAVQAREVALHAPPGVLITDVGSTKQGIVAEIDELLPNLATFLGSHPLAGSEKTGPGHAKADLLVGRVVVVTPVPNTPPDVLAAVRLFWEQLGAKVLEMSPADHDAAVAATSHVPHAIASALAAATSPDVLPLVAGGWLDTTRIAAGDVELWRQILLSNAVHSLRALDKFETVLSQLRRALEVHDGEALCRILEAGKKTRDAVGN
jgi:prephenate dehydrogenase